MIKKFSEISLLIIAGGQSSRMRQDKRFIEIGGVSLLESLLIKASKQNFAKMFLCVEDFVPKVETLAMKYDIEMLFDKFPKAGPMDGLIEGLENISTNWAFAVSCDMPFFEFTAVEPLLNQLYNAKVVMFDHQPLAAFYHHSMSEVFKRAINDGNRKLQLAINQVPHKILQEKSKTEFFNVNTPADLRLARGRATNINRKLPIISIIAPSSGTGKTTFIEKLIPKLNESNIRIGVVKSDSHGFNLDIEGKDSYKFQQAGAKSVAVISPNGWFINQQTDERADSSKLAAKFDDVDLILTESRSRDTIPAISLYRNLGEPLINDNVVAIFTNKKIEAAEDVLQCNLDDIDRALEICIFLMGR